MGQTRENQIAILFGTAEPSAVPAATWPNRSPNPDSYLILHTNPTGAPIALLPTAVLWAYDRDSELWGILEQLWRTVSRSVPAGKSIADYVDRAYPRGSALYIQYPTAPTGVAITAFEVFRGVYQ